MKLDENYLDISKEKVSIKPDSPDESYKTLLLIISDKKGNEFELHINLSQAVMLIEIIKLYIAANGSHKELEHRKAIPQDYIC